MAPTRALARGVFPLSQPASRASQTATTKPIILPLHSSARRISQSSQQPSPDTPRASAAPATPTDLDQLFAHPTWSVRTLLSSPSASHTDPSSSSSSSSTTTNTITPATLHHHLRLSALPPPASPADEARLLATLRTQLRLVRAVQAVDTAGVEPLRAIRDESAAGRAEATLTLARLRGALAREVPFGFRRRPRRTTAVAGEEGEEAEAEAGEKKMVKKGEGEAGRGKEKTDEEMLVERATAARRVRGYYVVESGKAKGGD